MNDTSWEGKTLKFERRYPGCLGRMVNLFELNTGVSANRLLTDKPHQDGSPLSRSRSDVSRISPSTDGGGEVIMSEFRNTSSDRTSNGRPMKMLIAQEMSKEVDSGHTPPNLVAKLMGLDALPRQEPHSIMQRSHFKGHSRYHSDIPMGNCERQHRFCDFVEPRDYNYAHENMQQHQISTHRGRYNGTRNEKRMALVRQKFVEAKCLSTDHKLRQSKNFLNALEVLDSNKDLFLKYLQEPNSVASQHLYDLQSGAVPPETKRITVLRPSRMTDSNSFTGDTKKGVHMKKVASFHQNELEKADLRSSHPTSLENYESPTPLTQIVVLKPSIAKLQNDDAMGSLQSESVRTEHDEDNFWDVEDCADQEPRAIAKVTRQQMHEDIGGHPGEETLICSVFCNGYVADESSFNKSEIEFPAVNLSDSEVLSPVSRHSLDWAYRLGSPYSSSSFSRASYSPESSVCREAKKRLSERWAVVASNGSCQEQRNSQRSSSTLGEMLALSKAQRSAMPGEEGCFHEEPMDSNSSSVSQQKRDKIVDGSPMSLIRSNSVPVSSTLGTRLNTDIPVPDKGKPVASKEDIKTKSARMSLKGKISSLFFSKNKKSSKEKSLASETKDIFSSFQEEINIDRTESFSDKGPDKLSCGLMKPSTEASRQSMQGVKFSKTGVFVAKPIASGYPGENQDQPSPISVLDSRFEEDEHTAAKVFPHVKPDRHGAELSLNPTRKNLLGKSPPIGSIARTISWDDSSFDAASSYPIKKSLISFQGREEGEPEWFFFVEALLSVTGLTDDVQSNSFLAQWHSGESPLDPSLRDKYIDLNEKGTLHEAARRRKRSMQKLVFDCVNAALVDIAEVRFSSGQRPTPGIKANNSMTDNTLSTMMDEVRARMTGCFSGEVRCGSGDNGDENGLVVERVVRKEVAGKGWSENLRMEMDKLGQEIEGELLEELVQESVVELTGRV